MNGNAGVIKVKNESMYWLELLKETEYFDEKEFEAINADATELLKMLRSAVISAKKCIS